MTETIKDFYTGERGARRIRRLALAVVLVGATAGAVGLAISERQRQDAAIAESNAAAKAWTLAGPPCPTLTAEAFAPKAAKATKVFEFDGDTYARRYGHADCNLTVAKGRKDPVPVCQFTSPAVLSVTTRRGTYFFEPGVGRPAAVSVVDETPSCVLASNFGS